MASAKPEGLRFFGVVDADDADTHLLDEQKVWLVKYRDLAGVVTAAPYVSAKPTDQQLEEYLRVVDALAARGPVVPAPPGAVFRDATVLSKWLDVHYAKLHEALGVIEQREDGRPPYEFIRMELKA
jgi:hypothetical protein